MSSERDPSLILLKKEEEEEEAREQQHSVLHSPAASSTAQRERSVEGEVKHASHTVCAVRALFAYQRIHSVNSTARKQGSSDDDDDDDVTWS